MSAGASSSAEERVDRLEQILDVLAGRLDVRDVAVVVAVRRADQGPPVPRQREDRPLLARRHDARGLEQGQLVEGDRDVGAAARARSAGTSSSREDLLRPDAVGPDPGRIDHVVGPDLEALAACRRPCRRRPRPWSPSEISSTTSAPLQTHRAEALRLAEHGEHQPGVVGLAVVEQIGLLGVARGQRRDQLGGLLPRDRAVAVRRPVSPPGCSTRRAPRGALARLALAPALADAGRRHHVVHVQPDPDPPVAAFLAQGRDEERESDRRDAARARPSAGAPGAPRGPGRGRSSAGSEARRGPSSTSGWRCRRRSRRARRAPPSSRARRRRGPPPRR